MLSMAPLTRVIVTGPFATMRLLALPRSNLLVAKGLSAMLMISMNGKVHQFTRMIIGRTPSSGSTKVRSSLKLPMSSLPTGGVLAKPTRALRRLASLEELPFTTRKLPLVTLKTWVNAHSRADTIPSLWENPRGLPTPTRISRRLLKGNATCLTYGLSIPGAVMTLSPART